MYHNNEISIINLSRLQCIVSVSVSANNFSTNTRIGNIGRKWYRSISTYVLWLCHSKLVFLGCSHMAVLLKYLGLLHTKLKIVSSRLMVVSCMAKESRACDYHELFT